MCIYDLKKNMTKNLFCMLQLFRLFTKMYKLSLNNFLHIFIKAKSIKNEFILMLLIIYKINMNKSYSLYRIKVKI